MPPTPTIRISNRARRVSLKITPRGELMVVSPRPISERKVAELIAEHAAWITKHMPSEPTEEFKLHDGMRLTIYGDEEKVSYQPLLSGRPKVVDGVANLEVYATNGAHEEVLKKWLLQNARQGIIARVQELAEQFKFNYNKVAVRDQSTRWGSCSSQKNLNFSWRLMLAPLEVLDYVIIHELAHTQQMNHSPKFWAIVERCMPSYKNAKKWLRDNARGLHMV